MLQKRKKCSKFWEEVGGEDGWIGDELQHKCIFLYYVISALEASFPSPTHSHNSLIMQVLTNTPKNHTTNFPEDGK
jgi:hypothetical protein